ncbi:MAG: M4 family metallopeptidase [Bacteroidia bacterium]
MKSKISKLAHRANVLRKEMQKGICKTKSFFAFLILHLAILILPSAKAQQVRLGAAVAKSYSKETKLPNFIKFTEEQKITNENFVEWASHAFNLPSTSTLKAYSTENDKLGFTHTRYKQYANSYPIEGTMVITHSLKGVIRSVNGEYFQNLNASYAASLSEESALQFALKKVNAKKYKWDNKAEEAQKRKALNNPNFTYYPKGELVVIHKKGADYSATNLRLAYKFNIYAEEPLSRANVFVDAQTGEILDSKSLICNTDAVGSAVTVYSGTVTMTSDNYATNQYRLRETGRGLGINTYNLNNTTTYTQTDFTNTTSAWNLAGTNQGGDKAATDAHWGAESTYDYYSNVHSRNSIDNAGYALNSYVHYGTSFNNAYWDGTEMTYGDGAISSGFLIFTALDVCGHEITHGLTNFTSGLNGGGTDEASALNEGNSDIFGTTIEWYARPTQHDWLMGEDITCSTAGVPNHVGLRDMSNPKNLGQPNCYMGINWDPAGECHNNNGPFTYWYYLLCQGGSGTNDLGNAWSVTGITMAEARLIAFRGNTVYFTPTTTYADARTYMIEAATDLYGACSQELASTINAWYAVGVGAASVGVGVPLAAFSANNAPSCAPLSVTFVNNTAGATTYTWNFGDGATSTATSPVHTYTASGVYTVQLIATGTCSASSIDTLTKINYITVVNGTAAYNTTFFEGFETASVPGTDWSVSSTAGSNWMVTSTAAASGAKSVMINNMTNTAGDTSILTSPTFNLAAIGSPVMKFAMSYQQQATTNTDKMQVYVSTDCGATWISKWARSGYILQPTVVSGQSTSAFVPTPSQFATYTINISSVASSTNAMFRWAFYAGSSSVGNNIYLDNINVYNNSLGVQNIETEVGLGVYPNPAHSTIFVKVAENSSSISISDVIGQTVVAEQKVNDAQQVQNIDIANLADGVYFMKINSTDNQQVVRFIKN